MKKLLAMILSMALLLATGTTVSLAENDKVEISFCVGDSTLIINGEAVNVEKPYVVGEGVTLVPVRVITEAFGAVLDWEGTTKTIILDYNGTRIILQIGNSVATINGVEKTLLSAPELTSNGFTMVPIRFISENFGADVGYDPDTKRVTVTGEKKTFADLWKSEKKSDGSVIYSSDGFGISLEIPALFSLPEEDSNEIIFESNGQHRSKVIINIYSKSSVSGSSFLGRQIIKETKNRYSMSAVATDTDVSTASYKNFKGVEYSGQVKTSELTGSIKNVFFENGDFVYNVGIFIDDVAKADKNLIENILNSVSLKDASLSAATFSREAKKVPEPFLVSEISRCKFTLPGNFEATDKEGVKIEPEDEVRSDKRFIYTNGDITFEARRISFKLSDAQKPKGFAPEGNISFEEVRQMFSYRFRTNSITEIVEGGNTVKFGDNKFIRLKLYEEGDDHIKHHEIYVTEINDAIYMFYMTYPEIHYSTDNRSIMTTIMRSIELDIKKN